MTKSHLRRAEDAFCCWGRCLKPSIYNAPLCAGHLRAAWMLAELHMADLRTPVVAPNPFGPLVYDPSLTPPIVPRPRSHQDSLVYYVRLGSGHVKIGYTMDLRRRCGDLRLDFDAVLAAEPGGRELEAMRHAQFAHLRQGRREDFELSPDLASHIEMIRKRFGDPAQMINDIEARRLAEGAPLAVRGSKR